MSAAATGTMPNVVSFPPGSVILETAVPPFETPLPTIRFEERVPPKVMDILRDRWSNPHHEHKIVFHLLRNVFVSGEGLIFDQFNNLYRETIAQNDIPLMVTAHERLVAGRSAQTIPFTPGPSLLCGKIGMSNYGHWMVEMLPLAFVARHWIHRREWRVFLPTIYPWMADVIRDSLGLLGIARDQCIENDGSPVLFEELVFVSGVSMHGHYYLPVSVECMDAIGESITPSPAERVWISRAGERRALLEEAQTAQVLETLGWAIVDPRKLTLREQIQIGKGARHMAGVSGAGLTNMGFMRPGGILTDFMPATMPDIFYWHLAVHRGLTYREIRTPVISDPDWFIEWDGFLETDLSNVLAQLGNE